MSSFKAMVLKSFKKLHRTRMRVFEGDPRALTAARLKINEEYKKNKHVTDEISIRTMIQLGEDVERELRTRVIQAKQVRPGVYEAKITDETAMVDNIPYNESAVPADDDGGGGVRPCCRGDTQRN